MLNKYFKGLNKKEVISWSLYDFANSAYTIIIISFVFPIYFKNVIAGNSMGDFYWGLAVSLSILVGAILSPIIGAIADTDNRRKSKLMLLALISMVATAMLFFVGPNMLFYAFIVFVLSSIFFELAQSLYDSFLPQISGKQHGKVSRLGWGLGFLGGIVIMLLLYPLYSPGYAQNDFAYRLVFPLTALFFFIFALPMFIVFKDEKKTKKRINIKKAFNDIFKTFKNIKRYKRIWLFLLAVYFMNDALVTVFSFLPIYANNTLGLTLAQIMPALFIVQLVGFVSTIFLGALSDKLGSKKILLAAIIIWIISIIMLYFGNSLWVFYLVAVTAGFAIGSSQAIARSWLSRMIPLENRSQFFGFNGFATKIAATTGPLLFGIVSVATGNQRIALLSIILLFAISFVLFSFVKE